MKERNEPLRRRIVEAVQNHDAIQTEAWNDLALLSSDTQIDTLETFVEEVRIDGATFSGPLLWYVKLSYGQENRDGFLTFSESFPGSFEGRLDDGQPVIERMTADTSSFYE